VEDRDPVSLTSHQVLFDFSIDSRHSLY
jgi:hypothetical protein